jgi:hypothetical protein
MTNGNTETKEQTEVPKVKNMIATAKFGGEQQEDDSSQPIADRRKKLNQHKSLLKNQ